MRIKFFVCVLVACLLSSCSDDTPQPDLATPPAPEVLLDRAAEQQELGQYDQAAGEYQQIITQYPESPEARIAAFGLGHSAFLRQDWAAARSLFEAFLASKGQDAYTLRALFFLGRVAEIQGDHEAAVRAYARYAEISGPLNGYAHMRRAAQLDTLQRPDEALAAYVAAGGSAIAPVERVKAYDIAIARYDARGDAPAALEMVRAKLGFVRSPGYRPSVLADGAARARALGRPDDARPWLTEIVERYPESAQAPAARDDLAALGAPVPAIQAARIAFAHQEWSRAVAEYDQALASQTLPPEEAAEARRRRALALREQGDYGAAIAALDALAAEQPDTPIGRQARLDSIQTSGQFIDRNASVDGYRQFAAAYPDDPLAPEALRRAAEIISWSGDPVATANAQLALGGRYPGSSAGQEALHEAALFAYQNGQYPQALAAWRQLGDGNAGMPRARGYYWAGRTATILGDQEQARTLMEQAYAAAPNSYYGTRAADILGIAENAGIPIGAQVSTEAETQAREWIATWHTATTSATLDVAPFRERASELALVDLPNEALSEWIAARDAASGDPAALYDVALAALRANAPYAAVTTAQQLMQRVPDNAGEPPVGVRQVLYPTPYATAMLTHSAEFGLDPLILYALMRQESIFNPSATSWVGARGLAQVMPATGQGIAANLGIQNFDLDDLYRPSVSIRFGAFYIDAQIERMNGSIHAALAGYNGGPGNAERWAGGNIVADPDVFLETIDFPETSHYVEVVYANYGAYRRLYRIP